MASPETGSRETGQSFAKRFDETMKKRLQEADAFYNALAALQMSQDAKRVVRQAVAGMLWSKQYYSFDLEKWLQEHGVNTKGAVSLSRFATGNGPT